MVDNSVLINFTYFGFLLIDNVSHRPLIYESEVKLFYFVAINFNPQAEDSHEPNYDTMDVI